MTRWTLHRMPDQSAKTVVITGASSGLGLQAASAFAACGARVVMACRPGAKARVAHAEVVTAARGNPPELIDLDLADLTSVRSCAEAIRRSVDHVDVLMLNAGVMAVPRRRTADGHECHFGTNHLGHFALAGLLMPQVLTSPEPRVVTTTSLAHWVGRIRWHDPNWTGRFYSATLAYGQSKMANLLFMKELDRRARDAGTSLVSTAAHPGSAHTNLASDHDNVVARAAYTLFRKYTTQPAEQGVLPLLYAASAAEVPGGSFWGPDGLLELHGHPSKARAASPAHDAHAAMKLWTLSTRLTGVSWDETFPPRTGINLTSTEDSPT